MLRVHGQGNVSFTIKSEMYRLPVNIPNQSKLSQETFSKDHSPSLELCNFLFALLVTSDNFYKYISYIIEKIFIKLMPQTGYCARQ